jgi:outer membrane protein OmpA-like peptidoglycan-associated protein
VVVFACVAIAVHGSRASAQATLRTGLGGAAGFGTSSVAHGDDTEHTEITLGGDLESGLEFFGSRYRSIYVNTNGTLSFGAPERSSGWAPDSASSIAVWWADVDTRGVVSPASSNTIYWALRDGELIVTWHEVGSYRERIDPRNSFQAILTDRSDVAPGDFDIELRYASCGWVEGESSGDDPAAVGLTDGTMLIALPGSGTEAVRALCERSNVGSPGVWRLEIRDGVLAGCGDGELDPGEGCDEGDYVDGDGCSSRCEVEGGGQGERCASDGECDSGVCADGVCCDRRCDGQCEACSSRGACEPVIGAPRRGRAPCDGAGACAGTCDGTVHDRCAYPGVTAACEDALFCTVGDHCDGGGACIGGGERACDDGLSCTDERCDEDRDECAVTIESGCAIDGACAPEGSPSPVDPCLVCDPARSRDQYSPVDDATIPGCGGDGGATVPDGGAHSGLDADRARDGGGVITRGSGPSCAASGTAGAGARASWVLLMLAALLLARRRRSRALPRSASAALACGALAALACASSPASAQSLESFRLDRYAAPPSTEDGLAITLPTTLGHLRPSVALALGYAHGPLVTSAGDQSGGAIVEHLFTGQLTAALGLTDRLEIHVRAPMTIAQAGDSPVLGGAVFPSPATTAIGDGSLGVAVRVLGEGQGEASGFELGFSADLLVPLGMAELASDTEVGARGQAMLAYVAPRVVTIALQVGAAYRPERDYGSTRIGSELTFGGGVYVPLLEDRNERLLLAGEVWGASIFRDQQLFTNRGTPLEALFGARYVIDGVTLSMGGGLGLTASSGTPDARALLALGYTPGSARTEPIAPEPIAAAPRARPDDRDGDRVLAPADACPDQPEDRDAFQDADGCPDPDDDADGVLDGDDRCVLQPEDVDTWHDEDGCPDPDNDGDGVLDVDDRCPLERGSREAGGCVRAAQLDADSGQIRILERVEFGLDDDRILESSERVLGDVRDLLQAHPGIRRLRVEGHTDSRGPDDRNLELSARRARSVIRWLVEHGIEPARLEGAGCGEIDPIESNQLAEGQQINRRVELHVLDPSPPQGARDLVGCRAVELGTTERGPRRRRGR